MIFGAGKGDVGHSLAREHDHPEIRRRVDAEAVARSGPAYVTSPPVGYR